MVKKISKKAFVDVATQVEESIDYIKILPYSKTIQIGVRTIYLDATDGTVRVDNEIKKIVRVDREANLAENRPAITDYTDFLADAKIDLDKVVDAINNL